jgi:Rad3-related DNA helicase
MRIAPPRKAHVNQPHGTPFPRELVVVCRRPGGSLHARSLSEARASDASPEPLRSATSGPAHATDADSLGYAYLDAVREMAPQLDLLRMAHDALPAAASVERSLLAQALAQAAQHGLRGRGARSGAKAGASSRNPLVRRLAAVRLASQARSAPLELRRELLGACFEAVASRWPVRDGGFETRDGQLEMAHAVLDTLLERAELVVEAGTGTGKSLAYALPVVVYAWWTGERVVLSTHTRNLQQQLVAHDLPLLWSCLELETLPRPDERRGLHFAKLLGRGNYMCRTALERCVQETFAAGGSLEVARLVLALLRSGDGSMDEVLPGVRGELLREVRSRRETCVGRGCRREPACPVYRARETARGADVVVVNHALLFADARSEGNILGDFGALVLDEAHNLERIAADCLGFAVGRVQAESLLASARRMESELRALTPGPEADRVRRAFASFAAHLGELRDGIVRLLDALDTHLPMAARVRSRQRYRDPDEVFGAVRGELEVVRATLTSASRSSAALLIACQEVALQEESAGVLELAELLVELRHEAQTAFEFIVRAEDDDWVYYLDFAAPGDALHEIVAAPLDVAPAIQRSLASRGGRVYTSATLLVEGDSAFFRRGVGLQASVPLAVIESPFDYAKQCSVVHTTALGDYRDADFVPRLATLLARLHRRVGRRTLVLLTSYAMLRALHAALRDALGPQGAVLAQGVSGPRERLARQLAATPGAILLGTRSFWEGVDLPREALEILVLAKLPFLAPDEPVVEARCERMRAAGDDPFREFVLPEAVLRFRQGFGRLIRSQRDRGAVLLLDGRLDTRPYGESFASSLPARVERKSSEEDVVEHVAAWFDSGGPPVAGGDATT